MATTPLFEVFKWVFEASHQVTKEKVWDVITHAPQLYQDWWLNLYHEAPLHILIETSLILFILWLCFVRRTVDPKKSNEPAKLSPKEVEWLLDTWEPEPLAPTLSAGDQALLDNAVVVEKCENDYVQLRGVQNKVLNSVSFDFLGLSQEESVKQAARDALNKYGCGSCGPRGFYGTIDLHLSLEKEIAEFVNVQEAICYSDGASATSSAIPAFSKKGDLLLVDEACSEPILMGANLSRSTVKFFKHNDMNDLRRLLEAVREDDERNKRDTLQQRRFIIVEGIYRTTGDICPLPTLLKLKEEFFYRLILDESTSFGVLGANGRGVTEHFGVDRSEVEITTFTLDTVLASVGGICAGSREIVDHQRLSGAGYCFSASSAPFLCAGAIAALNKLKGEAPVLLERLHQRAALLHKSLQNLPLLEVLSKDVTPVMHLALKDKGSLSREAELITLENIAQACLQAGVGVVVSKHGAKYTAVRPSLMVTVHATFSEDAVVKIASTIDQASRKVLHK